VKEYLETRKLAFCDKGDQIKYDNRDEIEWVFSLRYGWCEMPEEIRAEFTKYKFSWEFYGNYYSPTRNIYKNGLL
jgi:hypothetical protein